VTHVSASERQARGRGRSMLYRLLAPIADALKWGEPFDWDDDEP
jgi:hypothetical protein